MLRNHVPLWTSVNIEPDDRIVLIERSLEIEVDFAVEIGFLKACR
jgi:hypothetical protein